MEKLNTSNQNSSQQQSLDFTEKFITELKELPHKKLKIHEKSLNYLASQYDPYSGGEHLNEEIKSILNRYELISFTQDPFKFTNILLKLIDLTQEEIKKRLQ